MAIIFEQCLLVSKRVQLIGNMKFFLLKVEKSNAPNVCNLQIKIIKEIFALTFDLYYSRSYKFSHN